MSRSPARYRYAVDHVVDGDIRFLAHNDMVRMFARALARAALPVCFTGGFNPHMRLSLPFPRPVGQSSDVERLLLDLGEAVCEDHLLEGLQREMPAGIRLRRASTLDPSDSSQPRWVRYAIDLALADADALTRRAESLLASDSVKITRLRHKDGRSKVVEVRPFIDTIDVTPRGVHVSVRITDAGAVTPAEVCGALDMEADAINHLIRRVEIRWHKSQPKDPTAQ